MCRVTLEVRDDRDWTDRLGIRDDPVHVETMECPVGRVSVVKRERREARDNVVLVEGPGSKDTKVRKVHVAYLDQSVTKETPVSQDHLDPPAHHRRGTHCYRVTNCDRRRVTSQCPVERIRRKERRRNGTVVMFSPPRSRLNGWGRK